MQRQTSVSPIVLFFSPSSSPCAAVWMTCKHLGLKVKIRELNLLAREQMSLEFLKVIRLWQDSEKWGYVKLFWLEINPQHSVPTIDDEGFYLWERCGSSAKCYKSYMSAMFQPCYNAIFGWQICHRWHILPQRSSEKSYGQPTSLLWYGTSLLLAITVDCEFLQKQC